MNPNWSLQNWSPLPSVWVPRTVARSARGIFVALGTAGFGSNISRGILASNAPTKLSGLNNITWRSPSPGFQAFSLSIISAPLETTYSTLKGRILLASGMVHVLWNSWKLAPPAVSTHTIFAGNSGSAATSMSGKPTTITNIKLILIPHFHIVIYLLSFKFFWVLTAH